MSNALAVNFLKTCEQTGSTDNISGMTIQGKRSLGYICKAYQKSRCKLMNTDHPELCEAVPYCQKAATENTTNCPVSREKTVLESN